MSVVVDVTVLLPARKAGATLYRALGSTLWAVRRAQRSGLACEVVLVDHAAVDAPAADTTAVAARLQHRGPLRVLRGPSAFDLPQVLSWALPQCRGRFVARMDADDVMHPDRLIDDARTLDGDAGAGAVACRVRMLPTGATRTSAGMRAYVAWQNAHTTPAEHDEALWIEQPLCHPATTFRRTALDDVGPWRSGAFAEDYDLFLRLCGGGWRLHKREAVHHGWREHPGSATRTDPRYQRDTFAVRKVVALKERFHVDDRPVFVLGAGKEGGRIGRALVAGGVGIAAYLDVDPSRFGRLRHGARVHDAATLPALRAAHPGCFALGAVGTSGARVVVRAHLEACGFAVGVDAVLVA